MPDPTFETLEELEKWEAAEHRWISHCADPIDVHGALFCISRVRLAHAHLLTPSPNPESDLHGY